VTVRKGSGYGEPAVDRPDLVVANDAEARTALEQARLEGRPFPTVGLRGGDLWHTLGGEGGLDVAFPVDVGEVLVDGRLHLFAAHLVARTRTWSYAFVAMNAQWLGRWNAGPKAHPGDGLLDTYEARLSPAERLKVRGRLHHGAHLPHPAVQERRVSAIQVELPRPLPVVLDGEAIGPARHLSLRLRPDALRVIV
jgi:hypothetical protein